MKRESIFSFYPKYALDTVRKLWGYGSIYRRYRAIYKKYEPSDARSNSIT